MTKPPGRDSITASVPVAEVRIQLLSISKEKKCARRLQAKHDDLGDVRTVDEQLFCALTCDYDDWMHVLTFCAAARRLQTRDQRIKWAARSNAAAVCRWWATNALCD